MLFLKKMMQSEIEIKPTVIKIIMMCSIVYLVLPQIIFEAFAFKIWIAIISVCAIIGILILSWEYIPLLKKGLTVPVYVIVFSEIIIWTVFLASGMGGIMGAQSGDYNRSNAVLSDLVNYEWPVTYNESNNISVLNYYIAYFIPGAFLGKIFNHSFHVAEIATLIWSAIGMTLCVLLLFTLTKITKLKTVWLLFCWGGLDCIGFVLVNGSLFYGTQHLEHWASIAKDYGNGHIANYMSVACDINWNPQCLIPALMVTCLLMIMIKQNTYKLSVLLSVSLLFWSPLVAIGVFPFAVVLIVREKGDLKKFVSIPDILGIGFVALPMIFYYLSMNLSSVGGRETYIRDMEWLLNNWTIVLLFIALEFGIVGIILYKTLKDGSNIDKLMCITAMVFMALCLFIDYGMCHDFSMRATVISWIVLLTFAPEALENGEKKYKKYLVLYMIGATITSSTEYARMIEGVIKNGCDVVRSENQFNTISGWGFEYQYVGSPSSLFFEKFCRANYDIDNYWMELEASGAGYVISETDYWTIYVYKDSIYLKSKSGDGAVSASVNKKYEDGNVVTQNYSNRNAYTYGTLSQVNGLIRIIIEDYDWREMEITLFSKQGIEDVTIEIRDVISFVKKSYNNSVIAANITDNNWNLGIQIADPKKIILINYTAPNILMIRDAKSVNVDGEVFYIGNYDYDSSWIHVYVDRDATNCEFPNVLVLE